MMLVAMATIISGKQLAKNNHP